AEGGRRPAGRPDLGRDRPKGLWRRGLGQRRRRRGRDEKAPSRCVVAGLVQGPPSGAIDAADPPKMPPPHSDPNRSRLSPLAKSGGSPSPLLERVALLTQAPQFRLLGEDAI